MAIVIEDNTSCVEVDNFWIGVTGLSVGSFIQLDFIGIDMTYDVIVINRGYERDKKCNLMPSYLKNLSMITHWVLKLKMVFMIILNLNIFKPDLIVEKISRLKTLKKDVLNGSKSPV